MMLLYYIKWALGSSDTVFNLPEEYKGIPITKLGGAIDGFDTVFGARIVDDNVTWSQTMSKPGEGEEAIEINITLIISANIVELYCGGNYDYACAENADGSLTYYKTIINYECSPENPVFYAEGGKLYDKKTRQEAQWTFDTTE